jgi:hypothetical protein
MTLGFVHTIFLWLKNKMTNNKIKNNNKIKLSTVMIEKIQSNSLKKIPSYLKQIILLYLTLKYNHQNPNLFKNSDYNALIVQKLFLIIKNINICQLINGKILYHNCSWVKVNGIWSIYFVVLK